MSSSVNDKRVHRRHQKGRVHNDVTKSVSFDKNAKVAVTIDEQKVRQLEDSLNFYGRATTNLKISDSTFESMKTFLESCEKNEKYDFQHVNRRVKTTAFCTTKSQSPRRLSTISLNKKNNDNSIEFPLALVERGVFERQEDHKYSSTSNFSECEKEIKCMDALGCERLNGAKAHLIRKFFRSMPSKSTRECAASHSKNHNPPSNILYVKTTKFHELSDYSILTSALEKELSTSRRGKSTLRELELNPSLVELINCNGSSIYKVYKVLAVDSVPVLAVITSDSLFFVRYCKLKQNFVILHSYSFGNLVAAVLGPFSQLLIIVTANQDDKFFVNTGSCDSVASELIVHLEIALRRWHHSHKREFFFNVAQIHDHKCMILFHNVLPESAFAEDDILLGQFSVWLQEDYVETRDSPLGPEKEGYLMVKTGIESTWTPMYTCLKGGVIYIFEGNIRRIPKFSILLKSTCYKGCRTHNNSYRPHTFEVVLEGNSAFYFGAADETDMMEWIRDIRSSAVQVSNIALTSDKEKELPIINCFVTLSTQQILFHRFPNEIISRALLDDITTFTKSNWPRSYYCRLELSVREATEMGGDYILYFVSEKNFASFCNGFAKVTNRVHDDCGPEDDNHRFLIHKSDQICAQVQSLWDPFFIET